jgi:hypothetical protein
MALDVYFREDIANVARALGQHERSADYRAALVDMATAFGCDVQQIVPAHVISMRDVPVTIVAGPVLSCGHLRTSLRHWRNSVSGLTGEWCSECEVERARTSAGNGG